MPLQDENIPLSEMISCLRQELRVAMSETDDVVGFSVEKAIVEFTLTMRRKSEGGLRIAVLTGKSSSEREGRHRMTLEIRPFDKSVSGERSEVSELQISHNERSHVGERPATMNDLVDSTR